MNVNEISEYQDYLNTLAKNNAPDIFMNGGIGHASVLMATLFQNTNNGVRMFCTGLNPKLIMTEPYGSAFKDFVDRGGSMKVLMECDTFIDKDPFRLLKEAKENGNKDIQIRLIKEKDKEDLFTGLNTSHCNFSVFDNNKVRFEMDPENYKAFGSFNYPELAGQLSALFDHAYENAEVLV